MKIGTILLIILAVLIVAMVVLYFVGKRLQKKQEAQQQQIEAQKQVVNLLIIDKKRLPIKDSGLPQQVIDQVPKLMRLNKMPIVKVKAGPRIMTMIADEKIFDALPVKKEVKATVSGIYIIDVKALHGKIEAAPPKKKTLRTKLLEKRDSLMKKTTSSK